MLPTPNSFIAALEEQPHGHALKLFLDRLPKFCGGQRLGGLHDRSQHAFIGHIQAYLHSMHRHSFDFNAARRAPYKLRIHASDVIIGDVVKRLIGKLHGMLEHQLMVHGGIVHEGGAGFHSYFPFASIAVSSLFLSNGGHPNASEFFGGLRK